MLSPRCLLLTMAFCAVAPPAIAQSIPVLAGQEAGFDACASQIVVRGLDPSGDGFLAVRSGPGAEFEMEDKVYNGQMLHYCDQRGPWIGVVYTQGGLQGCNVTTPWPRTLPYTGPCRFGWVHRNWVTIVAG